MPQSLLGVLLLDGFHLLFWNNSSQNWKTNFSRAIDSMADEQTTYDSLFGQLASDLRVDGWQATQETPPGAYVHISR